MALVVFSGAGLAEAAPRTLVLPPRTVNVPEATARVFASLLGAELENRGVAVFPITDDLPAGADACDASDCAPDLARGVGADRVVYGTLTGLGRRIFVRIRSQDVDAGAPDYSDQITATTEADLDAVARRIAETLTGGQPNAERATLSSITEHETRTPRRRASRAGVGLRGAVLFPAGDSYGGASQLAGFRLTTRYETPGAVFLESTPMAGLMWGGGNLDWTILDVAAGRVLGNGDSAPYVLAGLGLHAMHLQRRYSSTYDTGYGTYTYDSVTSQNATTLTGDVGFGWMLMRTYDFSLVLDVRYHVVFGSFDDLGGSGAHGIQVSFGTTR